MQTNTSLRIVRAFIALFFLTATLPLAPSVQALGVSPGIIETGSLTKNTPIQKTIQVSRIDTRNDTHYAVTVSGPASKYITLSAPTLTIKSGNLSAKYTFTIDPKNAPSDTFAASVTFSGLSALNNSDSSSTTTKSTQMGLMEAASVRISFSVTDKQTLSFSIVRVTTSATEADQAPDISFVLKNDGNVDAKPDKIVARITNEADASSPTVYEINTTSIPYTSPKQEGSATVSLPTPLPLGKYIMEVDFFSEGKIVHTASDLRFQVLPTGTLAQRIQLNQFSISPEVAAPGELVKATLSLMNKGTIATKVTPYVEVKLDGVSIDILKGDEKLVGVQNELNVSIPWRALKAGTYEIEGYGSYQAGETTHLTKQVLVNKKNVSESTSSIVTNERESSSNSLFLMILLFILGLIVALLLAILLRKKKTASPIILNANQLDTAPPATPITIDPPATIPPTAPPTIPPSPPSTPPPSSTPHE